jgi:hypothetical protein
LVLLAIVLSISPLFYMATFPIQEAALPRRSPRARAISALACGASYVLLLRATKPLTELACRFHEVPSLLQGGVTFGWWLVGPAVVGLVAIRIERRFVRPTTIEVR